MNTIEKKERGQGLGFFGTLALYSQYILLAVLVMGAVVLKISAR